MPDHSGGQGLLCGSRGVHLWNRVAPFNRWSGRALSRTNHDRPYRLNSLSVVIPPPHPALGDFPCIHRVWAQYPVNTFSCLLGQLPGTVLPRVTSQGLHLATGLCVAACRQKRRVRFTTAANLVNELVEARQQNAIRRALARWLRYDLIALDEVGYVPLAEIGAEFLFQVIADRVEKATWIVTTNLPFSEWTQVFPNPRLCKALLDRITDRAHIIETGIDSYRFRRTMEIRQQKKKAS
jgi:IstB-like ATP binding protein